MAGLSLKKLNYSDLPKMQYTCITVNVERGKPPRIVFADPISQTRLGVLAELKDGKWESNYSKYPQPSIDNFLELYTYNGKCPHIDTESDNLILPEPVRTGGARRKSRKSRKSRRKARKSRKNKKTRSK